MSGETRSVNSTGVRTPQWPYTPINSEDRLVQKTFAEHLGECALGWEAVYAWNEETFRSGSGLLGRVATPKKSVLTRDLRAGAGAAQS
jgi:type I restriction enzyme R subunit